jgi:GDP-L-fucose synthase
MNKTDKVLVLGGRGMVGSALCRKLRVAGFSAILSPTRSDLNLLSQSETQAYFEANKPAYVFMAAAKVGGIVANNTYRADFILENLEIQNNAFRAALATNVENFLFMGSSCIYPKLAPQPLKESYLLTQELEPTNEPYAIAKIAGLKVAENIRRQYGKNYFSVMPTNLYGENDNYHPINSHVIPGLIRRMESTIKSGDSVFEVWGTGTPLREFLYVDDLAEACVFLMQHSTTMDMPLWLNVGSGEEISIGSLAQLVADVMGFKGKIVFNTDKPDGTPRKLLDSSEINKLGWHARTRLVDGIILAINDYGKKTQ